MEDNNFSDSFSLGQKGEFYLINKTNGILSNIVSKEDDMSYQLRGIDYEAVYLGEGEWANKLITVEMKTTIYESRNLFIEIVSNDKKNTPGWFYTTQSDIIAYIFLGSKDMLLINTKKMRELLIDKINDYYISTVPNYRKFKLAYSTKGALVAQTEITSAILHKIPLLP